MDESTTKLINVAVITGGHEFDVVEFHQLFRTLPGIDAYIQHLDDFSSSPEDVRDSYDAVVFYTFLQDEPVDDSPHWAGKPRSAQEHLGKTTQGIVVLHHALLAYPNWPEWDEIVGAKGRKNFGYQHDDELDMVIVDRDHPITHGLKDFRLVDESYKMVDASPENLILITVEHPRSLHTIAWTRMYQKSHVFCYQSGHDHVTFGDPNFRTILTRGIKWVAIQERRRGEVKE